ncbi:MAG: DUF2924 domain-containing protein, partial [Myxococcales bacterium]
IEKEVASLRELATGELRQRYAQLWNEEPRSRNRQYLIRRIVWRMQADAEGDLTKRARRRAEELADDAEVRATPPKCFVTMQSSDEADERRTTGRVRDLRLPPSGTSLVRNFKDRQIEVRVLDTGFEFDGERYKSLTAIAKVVTGTHCNGFRFFKLGGKS